MSLVSNLFLLFVAVSVLVYYIVPHKFQWLVLLCFSYIYYLAGGVRYVGFILFSTLVTWGIALAVEKAEAGGSHKSARNFLVLGLILNFGMLGVIKYTNFMIENLNALFHMNLRGMEILLPLGISFYTFQSSGYLLDVYWKRCDAERNPVKYALFVSFFPQILQGPIGRYSRLAHQLYEPHKFEGKNITRGFERILWGFFKKMILADWAAVFVDAIFDNPDQYSGLMAEHYRNWKKKFNITGKENWYHVFMIIRTFILVNISWFFDRADTVGQAFHMMKLSVTKFAPSQLLLIPAGKEGTAFTPYALAILAAGCIILFIVSVLQERGMKIRESLAGLSLPITVAIYFCLLASIGFFGSTAVARGFIYAQF